MARPEIWAECGFAERPSYQTEWSRFAELESAAEAFTEVVDSLVQHARRHSGGLVGRDVHVDGTEAETNARLVHDCRPGDACGRDGRRVARYPQRAVAVEARAERHHAAAEAPPEDPKPSASATPTKSSLTRRPAARACASAASGTRHAIIAREFVRKSRTTA